MQLEITVRRSGVNTRKTVNAYAQGRLAVHHSVTVPARWTVTHPESGAAVTGGRVFDSRARAMRFAAELQRHLDFELLKDDGAWDVQKAFGSENIRRAMSAAIAKAYAA